MARTKTPDRLDTIIDAATRVFMRRGYQQTRMEHVAEAAAVAPGTLYLYFDGKESLFELVLRRAFLDATAGEIELPYKSEGRVSIIERSWELVRGAVDFPLMYAGPAAKSSDVRVEFQALVEELYEWISRYWKGIRLIEKSATDWPELSAFFYQELRRDGLTRWSEYLEKRAGEGAFKVMPDYAVAARVIFETVAFFGMHRHTAPDSEMDAGVARATVLTILTNAFVKDDA